MTITPITPQSPGCYGVLCPKHGACSRYAAVDGAPSSLPVIGTCERDGERPLFLKLEAV